VERVPLDEVPEAGGRCTLRATPFVWSPRVPVLVRARLLFEPVEPGLRAARSAQVGGGVDANAGGRGHGDDHAAAVRPGCGVLLVEPAHRGRLGRPVRRALLPGSASAVPAGEDPERTCLGLDYAFIFSVVHFQFYGFFPRLVLGALLGYLFLYTRNLWVPIVVHFINNATVIVLHFFWGDTEWMEGLEEAEVTPAFAFMALISLLLTLFLFMNYRRRGVDGAR